jgi:nicotinate-nucleotide adenylyltransferase
MKTGIFGGTFNPIHIAHLRIAEEIRDAFGLGRIIFVPAATPPHKPLADNLSFERRLHMVRVATKSNPFFAVSDIEGKRQGKSYSIDTLHLFRELYPGDEFFFIMGGDSFAEFSSWKQYNAIFSCCNIVAITRPGVEITSLRHALPVDIAEDFCYYEAEKRLAHKSGYSVYYIAGTQLDISSTGIRESVKIGRSIKYLVPENVEQYIHEQRIYLDAH